MPQSRAAPRLHVSTGGLAAMAAAPPAAPPPAPLPQPQPPQPAAFGVAAMIAQREQELAQLRADSIAALEQQVGLSMPAGQCPLQASWRQRPAPGCSAWCLPCSRSHPPFTATFSSRWPPVTPLCPSWRAA